MTTYLFNYFEDCVRDHLYAMGCSEEEAENLLSDVERSMEACRNGLLAEDYAAILMSK